MNKPLRLACSLSALLASAAIIAVEPEWSGTEFMGWKDAIALSTPKLQATLVPSIGKIMAFSVKGMESPLWVNPANAGASLQEAAAKEPIFGWANFGGERLWAVQQSDNFQARGRAWPADPVLDGMPWDCRVDASGAMTMESRPSEACGVKAFRTLEASSDGSMLFIGQRLQALDSVRMRPLNIIQNVTAVKVPDLVVAKLSKDSHFHYSEKEASHVPDGVSPQCFPKDAIDKFMKVEAGYAMLRKPEGDFTGKFYADIRDGWLCAIYGDYAFFQLFHYVPDAYYPDGGCSVEVYVSNYYELELLSPARILKAGECMDFNVAWTAVDLGLKGKGDLEKARLCEGAAIGFLKDENISKRLKPKF